jgi:hypothetical protein
MRIRCARRLGALALIVVSLGCAPLAAWERGRLAQPQMALEPTPAPRALRAHVYTSREAATAAGGGQGAGCGCY